MGKVADKKLIKASDDVATPNKLVSKGLVIQLVCSKKNTK